MALSTKQRDSIRRRLRTHQNGKCCYCGQVMRTGKLGSPYAETIEHLQRRADGGSDGIHNLALACRSCNEGRGTMNWLVYATYKAGELSI